jgi:hypothetical protein
VDFVGEANKTISQIEDEEHKARLCTIALLTLDLKPKEKTTFTDLLATCHSYSSLYRNFQTLTGSLLYKMGPKKGGKDDLILDRHQPRVEEAVRKVVEGG